MDTRQQIASDTSYPQHPESPEQGHRYSSYNGSVLKKSELFGSHSTSSVSHINVTIFFHSFEDNPLDYH